MFCAFDHVLCGCNILTITLGILLGLVNTTTKRIYREPHPCMMLVVMDSKSLLTNVRFQCSIVIRQRGEFDSLYDIKIRLGDTTQRSQILQCWKELTSLHSMLEIDVCDDCYLSSVVRKNSRCVSMRGECVSTHMLCCSGTNMISKHCKNDWRIKNGALALSKKCPNTNPRPTASTVV